MTNGNCRHCGADRGLHHYQTDQCPVGGRESPLGKEQEWKTTTFEPVLDIPEYKNGDHTAYPFTFDTYVSGGLTKREYFAAMAMQGLLSQATEGYGYAEGQRLAEGAVSQADALIEALNK